MNAPPDELTALIGDEWTVRETVLAAVGTPAMIGAVGFLIAGLLTRLASVGLFFTMLGAMVLVHLPAGFFAPNGIEFPLALASTAVLLTLTGAGGAGARLVRS